MRRRWIVGAVLVLVALAIGAAATRVGPLSRHEETRADALWKHRTPYVGDSSRLIALASDAGFGEAGTYTLHLHTAHTPYALTVEYDVPADGDAPILEAQEDRAVALLGLVGNLDRVEVSDGTTSRSWTTTDATRRLGHDVKELTRDRVALDALAARLGPTSDG